MTPDNKKSLAEQILNNPLFIEILEEMEKDAIERLIYPQKEDIAVAQLRVQAIRTFQANLKAKLLE